MFLFFFFLRFDVYDVMRKLTVLILVDMDRGRGYLYTTNRSHEPARLVIYQSSRKSAGPPKGPDFNL